MGKTLVAYFSASATTARVAKELAQAAGADIYEIRPAVPYTDADLNWMDRDADIASYDTILLGFPIWWYVAPTIINSFLESYDFSGKKIVLFATSGGSGCGKTVDGLKPSVAADTVIVEGRLLNGRQTAESLKAWVETVL